MHSVSRELPCSRLLTCFRKSSFVVLRTGWEGTCTGLWGWDSSVTPYTDCREAANKQKRLWPFSLLCNEENCSTQNSKTTSQQFPTVYFHAGQQSFSLEQNWQIWLRCRCLHLGHLQACQRDAWGFLHSLLSSKTLSPETFPLCVRWLLCAAAIYRSVSQ